eukprot:CAMPEP_0118957176 /NCGR_PEP_ID=MMETSP1169-20130426/61962_1 /TAXON_ID=36882 /ORGANISM="Pyramimonas obovata, Strain CCMP722" /LENGTH=93 /DNA_ID=CAMNT_0006905231 /DNA_START=552 /DNA_END=833 /DNA_ORIENTATION=+
MAFTSSLSGSSSHKLLMPFVSFENIVNIPNDHPIAGASARAPPRARRATNAQSPPCCKGTVATYATSTKAAQKRSKIGKVEFSLAFKPLFVQS